MAELVVVHRPGHGRVGDLVAVAVEQREDGTVVRGVEELRRVPRGRGRPGLELAVAHDAGHDQVGVVERGAERFRQRVAELAALVDHARVQRAEVAGEPARPRERPHQPGHPVVIAAEIRIDLGERPVDPLVREVGGRAVADAGDQQDVRVGVDDQPVEAGVHEVDAGAGAPVPQQARLHVLGPQRLLEQDVRAEIDLGGGEVVREAPVLAQRGDRSRAGHGGGHTRPNLTAKREPVKQRTGDDRRSAPVGGLGKEARDWRRRGRGRRSA